MSEELVSPFIPAAATAKSVHGSPTRGHDSCQDTEVVLTTPLSSMVSLPDCAQRRAEKRGYIESNIKTELFSIYLLLNPSIAYLFNF